MAFSEEDNVHGFSNFDDSLLGEEYQESEIIQVLVDFDDSRSEKGSEDVVNLLPNDPFGMEFNMGMSNDPILMDFNISLPRDPFGMDFNIEATFAAITGLMEDFGLKAYGVEPNEANEENSSYDSNLKAVEDNGSDDSKYFTEVNFVWTSSMKYKEEDGGNEEADAGPVMCMEEGQYDERSKLCGDMDDMMCFGCEKYETEHVKDDNDADSGVAVNVIVFVLKHLNLGMKDLLSIERVCRSLYDAVRGDPYFWTSINIDYPLSQKITDADLLQLTDRAQGKLRCLSLVKCSKISKDGLVQVLGNNMELTKLSVAGSIKLNGDEILHILKLFNAVALPGIKHLRLGDRIGLTNEHLNEYKLLLGSAGEDATPSNYKPRFYRAGEIYLSLDNERAIDIEICPRCQKVGQIYDCPTENCRVKMHSTKTCRACIFCIARCIRCGCCLDGKAYHETFCFDFLCFECLEDLLFQDEDALAPGQTYFHQVGSYHFFLYS